MQLHQPERALVGLTKAFVQLQPPLLQSETDTAVWAVCGFCLSFALLLANDLHMAHEYAALLFFLLDKHTPRRSNNPSLLRVKAEVGLLLSLLAAVLPAHRRRWASSKTLKASSTSWTPQGSRTCASRRPWRRRPSTPQKKQTTRES